VTFAENNSTVLRNGAIAYAISKRRVNFPRARIASMITSIADAAIHSASSIHRVGRDRMPRMRAVIQSRNVWKQQSINRPDWNDGPVSARQVSSESTTQHLAFR
jgi:hypothetical protein